MGKHVIFLGAGASKTSGYPLGDDLRKDGMASAEGLRAVFGKALHKYGIQKDSEIEQFYKAFDGWVPPYRQSLQLFREGCFGTIDEFCKLIGKERPDEVVKMKKVLRFVLGLHFPELEFPKSDYYPFIQRLYASDLYNLRDDVVVISFNYDVYLEWLLRRASITREAAMTKPELAKISPSETVHATVTSGFSGGSTAQKTIRDGSGFCVLKLHGMIAWPKRTEFASGAASKDMDYGEIFGGTPQDRLRTLLSQDKERGMPPIVFPWEIMNGVGGFIEEKDFLLPDEAHDGHRHGGRTVADPHLYSMFKETWIRARKEVQGASKVSFVGLSMHEYLVQGLRYLFEGKTGSVGLVITDHDEVKVSGQWVHPAALSANRAPAKFMEFLGKACPSLICNPGASMILPDQRTISSPTASCAKLRKDFADFIAKEMN
jgi:hypothetical protein